MSKTVILRTLRPLRNILNQTLALVFVVTAPPAGAQVFSTPVSVNTGNRPVAIYAADINNDGFSDFIVIDAGATATASTTRILISDGQGNFAPSAVLATAGSAVGIGDFDGDGKLDIAWVTYAPSAGAQAWFAKGDGSGKFASAVSTSFNLGPDGTANTASFTGLTATRLRDSGPASLVFGEIVQSELHVLTFISGAFSQTALVYVTDGPGLESFGDINADGHTDVMILGSRSQYLNDFFGRGDGTLLTGYRQTGASTIVSQLFADMDGDGKLDHITEDGNGTIDIFPRSNTGLFISSTEIGTGASDVGSGRGGRLIAAVDLNNDCKLDLVTSTPLGISVLLGQPGSLNFTLDRIYNTGASVPTVFAVGDFNADGHPDLAVDSAQGVTIFPGHAGAATCAHGVQFNGAVIASPEPSPYGTAFTLTATIVPTTGQGVPTGSVAFSVDGAFVGSGAVINNAANYTLSAPAYIRGSLTLTATYSGDANYSAATLTGTHIISGLRSQTTINVTTPTIFYGQVADGIGSVAALDSSPTATVNGGSINFYENGNLICTLPINGTPGTCPLTAGAGLAAGLHVLTAAYSGNNFYDPSTSDPGNVQVLPDVTTAALASSTNPSVVGQPVTFAATIAAPYATPTGSVTFSEGSTLLGTGTLNASGIAIFTTSLLTIGTHQVTASYAATTNFNASTSAVLSQVVTVPPLPATTTLLSSSVNPSYVGQPVIFTATVSNGATPAAGAVNFMIDGVLSNPIALNAQGQAAVTAATLTQGSHTVIALFGATSTLAASTSASLIQQVNPQGAGGFTLTVSPTTLTVPIGSSVSVLVTVTPLNGFAQPVNLTCTGMPDESACTFANATIPAGGGVTRLTVTAAAPHDCGTSTPYFVASGATTLFDALATAALMFLLRRRRAVFKGLTLVLIFTFLPALSGCAGNCTDLGVRPGTYSFTVTATSTGSPAITVTQAASFAAHL